MKLAAIYNVWDGDELLQGSINSIRDQVDTVIVIYQHISNYGEVYQPDLSIISGIDIKHFYEPVLSRGGSWNETRKRNAGLEIAKASGCTHFICMDCDEYYQGEDFAEIKAAAMGYDGTAGKMFTYYKHPTDQLTPVEGYYVPLIHKIYDNTRLGSREYPVYADPTRRVSPVKSFYKFDRPVMHHFSYVRKDIMRKVRNSSARDNIARVKHFKESWDNYEKTGEMPLFLGHLILKVNNLFGILIK